MSEKALAQRIRAIERGMIPKFEGNCMPFLVPITSLRLFFLAAPYSGV
jgi:hypothetical protein